MKFKPGGPELPATDASSHFLRFTNKVRLQGYPRNQISRWSSIHFKKLIVKQLANKLPPYMEPEISVSFSQEPANYSYPDLEQTSLSPGILTPGNDAGNANILCKVQDRPFCG